MIFSQSMEEYSDRGVEYASGPYGIVERIDDDHIVYKPSLLGKIFRGRALAWKRGVVTRRAAGCA